MNYTHLTTIQKREFEFLLNALRFSSEEIIEAKKAFKDFKNDGGSIISIIQT